MCPLRRFARRSNVNVLGFWHGHNLFLEKHNIYRSVPLTRPETHSETHFAHRSRETLSSPSTLTRTRECSMREAHSGRPAKLQQVRRCVRQSERKVVKMLRFIRERRNPAADGASRHGRMGQPVDVVVAQSDWRRRRRARCMLAQCLDGGATVDWPQLGRLEGRRARTCRACRRRTGQRWCGRQQLFEVHPVLDRCKGA